MRYKDVRPPWASSFFLLATKLMDHARIDTLNIPNYTGSTGFGEFYVHKLLGKCGTLDVEDVKATVDRLVKEGKGEYGPGKQFVTGGSHGGFLTAHRECNYHNEHTPSDPGRTRHDSHRAIPRHVLRGGTAQPCDLLAPGKHGHPRLVLLRVRRASVDGERADDS